MRGWVWGLVLFVGCGTVSDSFTGDASQCANGAKDGNEADVDCGGSCAACGTGKSCQRAQDCASGFCTNGKCDPPSCTDGVRNGDESDVDCGGMSCMGCGMGKTCKAGTDCASGTCTNGTCAASQCTDGKLDGKETDVDCGGDACPKCGGGKMCTMGTDCASGTCTNNVCKAPAGCSNMAKDGTETDIDCGGGACPMCADGKACMAPTDCSSGNCIGNVCKPAGSCDDKAKNGAETDIDCGGGTCPKCGTGKACAQPTDCMSGNCINKQCSPLALDFAVPVGYKGATSAFVVAADFNGDGKTDLAHSGTAVDVLFGSGDGTFKFGTSTALGFQGQGIAATDFNGDNFVDVAVGDGAGTSIVVLLGKGDGTFQPPAYYSASGFSGIVHITAADLDGDGRPEIVAPYANQQAVHVYLNLGNGTFLNPKAYGGSICSPFAAAVADFDGDKKPDVAVANNCASAALLLGKGDGTLQQPALTFPAGSDATFITATDVNADQKLDMVVTDRTPNTISVLIGAGGGAFQPAASYPTTGKMPYVHTAADFNLDGNIDIAATTYGDNTVSVLLGKGDGAFQPGVQFPAGSQPVSLVAKDFNGDSKPDLAVSNAGAMGGIAVSVLLNTSK